MRELSKGSARHTVIVERGRVSRRRATEALVDAQPIDEPYSP
jgi:hypothetical protein